MPSGGGGNTTQQTEPWSGARPYLRNVYGRADDLYQNQPMTPFGGLSVDDRMAQATSILGGEPGQVAGQFGIDPNTLRNSIVSGVAAPSPEQMQAQQAALGLASGGIGPMFGQATDVVSDAMLGGGRQGEAADYYRGTLEGSTAPVGLLESSVQGDFLGGNPHLDAMYAAASRPIMEQFRAEILPGINSSFESVGRSGSPAHQFSIGDRAAGALGRSLTDMSANIYGSDYMRERALQQASASQLAGIQGNAAGGMAGLGGQQIQTALSAPALYQAQRAAELGNIGLLEGVGGQDQALAAALAGQASGTYGSINQEPWNRLGMYSNMISGLPSSSMTGMTTPYHTNPMAGAMGGALGGAAMGSMAGVPGMAIGGGLGLLGGYFM